MYILLAAFVVTEVNEADSNDVVEEQYSSQHKLLESTQTEADVDTTGTVGRNTNEIDGKD